MAPFYGPRCISIQDKAQKAALIYQHYNFSDFGYRTKLSRLAFLANALNTSSDAGQCSRWYCSKRSTSIDYSRSSVTVERIDVSVRCSLEKTRSDSHVITDSVPRMVSSRWTFGNLMLLKLLSAAVAVSGRCSDATEYTRC